MKEVTFPGLMRGEKDYRCALQLGIGLTTRISWRCACSMILEAKRPMLESRLATCSIYARICLHVTGHNTYSACCNNWNRSCSMRSVVLG